MRYHRDMGKRMHGDEEIRTNDLVRVIKQEKIPKGDRLKDIAPNPKNYKKFKGGETPKRWPRGLTWGIAALVFIFIAGFIVSYYVIKENVRTSILSKAGTIQAGVTDLQNFDPQSAQQQFSMLSTTSTATLGSVLNMFGSLFKGGSTAVSSFGDLSKQLVALSQEFAAFESGVFGLASTGQGSTVITGLTDLQNTLSAIDMDTNQLSGIITSTSTTSSINGQNFYLPLKAQIEGVEHFLTTFIPWLSASTPHHILVLLENSSELRPGGGFLGTYADVTMVNGNIANVAVHDIADVDNAFTERIIPPQPLQFEITSFRPADTNWFFDYPTSASKTIQFFESSTLYSASGTTFDAVIAVSPKVVSDLLSVTGPLTIMGSSTSRSVAASTTFTDKNLLVQIQNIVQQGQAKNTAIGAQATYPKAVIGALAQAIFQSLASSTDADKQQFFTMVLDWVAKKDVMVYFKDPVFENFFAGYGVTGNVDQLPQNFNGDYLAIVDSDINSDKSEAYIAQHISLDARINPDGTITDNLSINRMHNGNTSPYWWYRTTNQDYIQIFVPDISSLTNEVGGIRKSLIPPINYIKEGYRNDSTVATIESSTQSLFTYPLVTTHEEDGKEVFATWARVAAGASTTLEFDYTHRAFFPPDDGTQYQFIFEKQPGSNRNYDFEIDAPLGYVFAENALATYEYVSNDPPGRLVINLTLRKL